MHHRVTRRAARRADDPRSRSIHAGERRASAYGMARRYRSDQRPRGPPGLHGRRADDAGLQARTRPSTSPARRRMAATPTPAERPHLSRSGRRAFGMRRSVGPVAVGGARGVAAGSVERRRGAPCPTRSVRGLADRSPASPTTPSPGRCAGSRPTGLVVHEADREPATAASAPSRYRLTLPADRLRRPPRSRVVGATPRRRSARRPTGRPASSRSSTHSTAGPSATLHRRCVELPISPSRICTMVREARARVGSEVPTVLSVWKLAHGQEAYYLEAVARGVEDYYVGGEAPGRWIASSDTLLGLVRRGGGRRPPRRPVRP